MAEQIKIANSAELAVQIANKAPAAPPKTFIDSLEVYKGEFQKALGGLMPVDQFVRIVVTEIKGNEKLYAMAKRNPLSVVQSAIKIATWGLNPSIPNEVSLIPWEGKTQAVAPMIGYKGLERLALQAGVEFGLTYKKLGAYTICQHDNFSRGFGSEIFVTHLPPKFGEPRGEVIGFYGLAEDQHGRISYEEMTVAEMRAHKARFCRSKIGPFAGEQNFDRYGVKTMIRLLINRNLPMSPKLSSAVKADIALEQDEALELPELPVAPEQAHEEGSNEAD